MQADFFSSAAWLEPVKSTLSCVILGYNLAFKSPPKNTSKVRIVRLKGVKQSNLFAPLT